MGGAAAACRGPSVGPGDQSNALSGGSTKLTAMDTLGASWVLLSFASTALSFGWQKGAAALAASSRFDFGSRGSRIKRRRKSNGISPPASAASSRARVRLLSEPRGRPRGLPDRPGRNGRPRCCFLDLFTASITALVSRNSAPTASMFPHTRRFKTAKVELGFEIVHLAQCRHCF